MRPPHHCNKKTKTTLGPERAVLCCAVLNNAMYLEHKSKYGNCWDQRGIAGNCATLGSPLLPVVSRSKAHRSRGDHVEEWQTIRPVSRPLIQADPAPSECAIRQDRANQRHFPDSPATGTLLAHLLILLRLHESSARTAPLALALHPALRAPLLWQA